MKIHYNARYINSITRIGGCYVFLGLAWLLTGYQAWLLLPVGVILLIASVNARTRPYFTVEQNKIVLHTFFGLLTRTFTFNSQKDIKLQGTSLYVFQNGETIKIPVAKSIIDASDWANLEASYGQKQA